MNRIIFSLLILVSGLSAQSNGIDQTLNFLTPPTGGKFIQWQAKAGRSYFLQISDPSDHLNKWTWSTVIETGTNQSISYEVDGTAEKGFFRLHYTDQTATNLETADFDNDGLTNLQEITPVIRPRTSGARTIGGNLPPPNSTQTNPLDPDTDRDGTNDGDDSDPTDPDSGGTPPGSGAGGGSGGTGGSGSGGTGNPPSTGENPTMNSIEYRLQSEVRVAYFAGSIITRPSGEKMAIGAFNGNSPGSQYVYRFLGSSSQISKNNFVSQLEALPYFSMDDFTEQEQEDLSYPFEVNGFYQDTPFSPGRGAYQSDAGSSYLTGVGNPYTHEGDESPSTIETLAGTSRQTRFRIKASRTGNASFVATYLKIEVKKLGFQSYPYGLQEEITKVEPYTIQIPAGELYSEWHGFKTELVDGYTTEVRLIPVEMTRDEDVADGNWQAITGLMSKALPGQKMNLRVDTSKFPSAVTVGDFEWILPEKVFKDYEANDATGTLTLMQSSDLSNSAVNFYFADSGDKEIRLSFRINQSPIEAKFLIRVEKPTSSFATEKGVVRLTTGHIGQNSLGYFGATQLPYGMRFVGSVTTPQPWSVGTWSWVQLIRSRRDFTNPPNGRATHLGDGVTWKLDKSYPYFGGLIADGQVNRNIGDSPSEPAESLFRSTIKIDESFQTYLMFRPIGTDSRAVPLRKANWNWGGYVTAADNWTAVTNAVGEADAQGAVTNEHPQWQAPASGDTEN